MVHLSNHLVEGQSAKCKKRFGDDQCGTMRYNEILTRNSNKKPPAIKSKINHYINLFC